MSDLQCAVTVLLVRHGEAVPDGPGRVSDEDRPLTPRGLEQARGLGESLRERRVAAVYSSSLVRARGTADAVADVLGLPVHVVDGAHEFSVGSLCTDPEGPERVHEVYLAWLAGDLGRGCPDAETGHEVLARLSAVLDDLRDLHRGETVALVTHGGVMTVAAAQLFRGAPGDLADSHVPNCGVAQVEGDADGWVLRSWPGVPSDQR
jgi:2,3-bisphosphoglycerate-dependent phosphoglycerate mutase